MDRAVLDTRDGLIIISSNQDNYPMIEEIFAYKQKGADLCGFGKLDLQETKEFSELKLIKQPITIRYKYENSALKPMVKNRKLSAIAISTLLEYGYAVMNGKIQSCLQDERDLLKIAREASTPKLLLKATAILKQFNRLDGECDKILQEIADSASEKLNLDSSDVFPNPLYQYQRDGVKWLLYCYLNKIGTILADDMGLGKTAQIMGLIAECNEREILGNALIIVPSTLIENWKREFQFFYPSIIPYVHNGSIRSGLAEELSKYKVVICPYSIMVNDIEMIVDLNLDLLVFDEASLLKNPDSNRTLSAKRIKSNMIVAISGTPVENSLKDLWSIADLVFPGYLGDFAQFCARYIRKDIETTLSNDLKSLETDIRQIMIRRLKVDHLDELPERIDIPQPIQMTDKERYFYDDVIDSIRRKRNDKGAVLQEIIRLQQYTSHPELLAEEKCYELEHLKSASAKFCRLLELLEQISARNEKVIIFANHHEMLDILRKAIGGLYPIEVFQIDGRLPNEERQDKIDKFSSQSGFGVLLLNPRTAGMGLNITAANHVIHYSRQWNPALEEQATARAYRNGQQRAVNIYYLFYCDTIEDVINERLLLKKELSERVVHVEDSKSHEVNLILDYIGD